jgi:hypothetical protein
MRVLRAIAATNGRHIPDNVALKIDDEGEDTLLSINFSTEIQLEQQKQEKQGETEGNRVQHTPVEKPAV